MNYNNRLILAVGLLAASCDAPSVYDQPLPDRNDTDTLVAIRDGVAPEDRDAWQSISMMIANPMARAIESKTVREAITRSKARTTCMDKNAPTDADDLPVSEYNAQVEAYNACLRMPL